jgi:hypothetical protein
MLEAVCPPLLLDFSPYQIVVLRSKVSSVAGHDGCGYGYFKDG